MNPCDESAAPAPNEGEPMSRRPTILIAVALAALLLAAFGVATVAAGPEQQASVIKVTMTGDQEVIGTTCAPPMVCGDPDAVGTGQVVIQPAADRVCFNLKWSGVDGAVWGAHIHGPATTSEAAGIVVGFLMLAPGADDNLSGTDQVAGCV